MRFRETLVLGMAIVGLAAGASRAAVMTSTVRVSSGVPPYNISYILAQDMQFGTGTMTVNIRNAATNAIVRSFVVNNEDAMMPGPHESDVVWDGTVDGGGQAPVGAYYAEIVTTGSALSTMTQLYAPRTQTYTLVNPDNSTTAKNDGRFYYGHGANQAEDSPFRNTVWIASASNGNVPQLAGIRVANADVSPLMIFPTITQPNFDWISSDVLDDGRALLAGQGSGTLRIINTDGTTYRTIGGAGNLIYTRNIRAKGTADNARVVFIDVGSTQAPNVAGVNFIDLGEENPAPSILVPASLLPATARSMAAIFDPVTRNPTAVFVSGRGSDGAGAGNYVRKFIPPAEGSGLWVQDPAFNWTLPSDLTGNHNMFVQTSPDGGILWVAINNGNSTDLNGKRIVGVSPATGAPLGAAFQISDLAWSPQEMGVTHNGNLFVSSYAGNITGVTANQIGLVAPPDQGSSDTSRSFPFYVTTSTTNSVTEGPTVSDITYHGGTITWTTAFPGSTQVSYGTTTEYGTDVTVPGEPDYQHSATLNQLGAGTTYHYRVTSSLPGLSDAVATGQFTTGPLTISNIQVPPGLMSAGSVTVTWNTNEPSTSFVRVGEFPGEYGGAVGNNTLTTNHSVTLTGLTPNSTMFFVVESGWPGAPATRSAEGSFTTPSFNLITAESLNVTATSATLSFQTQASASATVLFGTSPDNLPSTATITGAGTTSLSAAFSGLSAGTTYYYSLSLNGASIGGTGEILGTFTTPAAGGTATTITHNTVADLSNAVSRSVQIGGAGALLQLERQGVPGTPILGPTLPAGNYYSGLAIGSGHVYLVGGADDGGTPLNTVYYIPLNADGTMDATAGWRTTTPLPEPRTFLNDQVFTYSGYLYVVGGSANASTHLGTVFYARINADGTVGQWQSGRPIPVARSFAGIIPVNGRILINGGFDVADRDTNYIAEIRPDGSLGPWRTTSTTDTPRNFHRAVTDGRFVYSVSDFPAAVDPVSSMAYAPTSPTGELGQTTNLFADLPNLQYAMAAGLLGGKIVVAAGRTTGNVPLDPPAVNYIQIMADGSLDFGWNTSLDPYPVAALDLDGEVYNGRLYAAGGRTVFSGSTPTPTDATVIIPMVEESGYAYHGVLESGVIDLGGQGSLQRLTVTGSNLTTANTEVRYRFAATAGGDGAPVFTDWFSTSGADSAISGGARYVQYQVILKGNGSATPSVTGISLIANVTSTALPGDVDKNGVAYERNDVVKALQIAGGLLSSTDPSVSYENADVAGGSGVDMVDVATIARRSNGL